MFSLLSVTEALLIVVALSMDAFVSSFAYGANKIKIPLSSVCVINLICSGILAAALLFGGVIRVLIPPGVTTAICFLLLLVLGCAKIFDSAVKAFIRRHNAFEKKIRFSMLHLRFILKVYADPEEADRDRSRILSPAEAAYLAVALSLDGLAVGFSAGITNTSPILIVALSLLLGFLAVSLGCLTGRRVTKNLSLDLNWLSGVMLVILAFIKLL